jgi:hypothetical protein
MCTLKNSKWKMQHIIGKIVMCKCVKSFFILHLSNNCNFATRNVHLECQKLKLENVCIHALCKFHSYFFLNFYNVCELFVQGLWCAHYGENECWATSRSKNTQSSESYFLVSHSKIVHQILRIFVMKTYWSK